MRSITLIQQGFAKIESRLAGLGTLKSFRRESEEDRGNRPIRPGRHKLEVKQISTWCPILICH